MSCKLGSRVVAKVPSIQPHRSTQSAWKQCGARHARLNRVKCTIARRYAHSTSESSKTLPRGSNGGRSPLARLSPLSFFTRRKMESPKGVRLAECQLKTKNKKIPSKLAKKGRLPASLLSYHNLSIQNLHRRLHHLRPGIHTPFLNKSVRLFLAHAVPAHQQLLGPGNQQLILR